MTIDTEIKGNPESVRAVARWLDGTVGEGVHNSVTQLYQARTNTETDWTGPAGEQFRGRMNSGGKQADEISTDAKKGAEFCQRWAGDMSTAQRRMEQLRESAAKAGLTVSGNKILHPGPAPAKPGNLAQDATSAQQAQHAQAVQAQQDYAKKIAAYNSAKTDAEQIRKDMSFGRDVAKNGCEEIVKKPLFQAGALADGTFAAGASAAMQKRMAQKARINKGLAAKLGQPGQVSRGIQGSDVNRNLRNIAAANRTANRAATTAKWAGRIGGRVPIAGTLIGLGAMGYDIHNGKPVGKAVVSTAAGIAASAGAGVAAGAAVGSIFPGAGTAAGAVVGGVVGVGVGLATSAAVDAAWDKIF
ncbi:hypothetical protein KIPE111705_46555 [Kibdelosporangium persicum]|uniref:Uncharacterized protein n=1 Tax=Kibdelosporangium persicum TaxID=2698649 RepID=A0ABX2FJ36_9PSEU|nr:hypothetical protein [Kibdelosporangium persicum]NRN71441.1 hypothetical protein [Kibdelosporangium persicum]